MFRLALYENRGLIRHWDVMTHWAEEGSDRGTEHDRTQDGEWETGRGLEVRTLGLGRNSEPEPENLRSAATTFWVTFNKDKKWTKSLSYSVSKYAWSPQRFLDKQSPSLNRILFLWYQSSTIFVQIAFTVNICHPSKKFPSSYVNVGENRAAK